jgi:predicted DsbA family dithiol-disulfide isomerase
MASSSGPLRGASLHVDIWSDIACPWCWVGKRRLEQALEQFAHADAVEVAWHAFELDPSAPRKREDGLSYAARLGKKYGTSTAQAELMIERMVDTAAKDGITMRFDRAQPGNTFDAHRLVHLAGVASKAGERGKQDAMKERLFRAYLEDGESIGDASTLAKLAGDVGLDVDEAASVLASDTYAKEVRADERQAAALGITGVPFFVFDRKYAVSGAQPAEALLEVLEKVWADHHEAQRETDAALPQGAACGPDGC